MGKTAVEDRSLEDEKLDTPDPDSASRDADRRAQLLEIISALGHPGTTPEEADELIQARLGEALGARLIRRHRPGEDRDSWRGDLAADDDIRGRLEGRLEVAAELNVLSRRDVTDWAVAQSLKLLDTRSVVTVPVLAEGRLVSAVQIFTDLRLPEGGETYRLLEILTGQLGLLASRGRMREAIRSVAKHARTMISEIEEQRSHSVLYDPVTGLPRRSILEDRIRQAIRRRQRSGRNVFGLLLVQVDGLERVRDSEGEEAVQEILLSAARRISALVRPADTVAHDGERLVVILEGIRALEDAREVADRVRHVVLRPYAIGSKEVSLNSAIGVVFAGPAYETAEALLADAEIGLRRARESEHGIQVFDMASSGSEEAREELEKELVGAVQRKDFFLEYQPIVALDDGRITGLEVLLRWRHPQMGLVPPNLFIPIADASPLVHQLGYWVIDETCVQIRRWQDNLSPRTPPPVAINITGRQLFHQEFPDRVWDILRRNGVVGEQIRFDISEPDLMRDAATVAGVLERIREIGIQVAVDDFGTGYSSLSLLHTLPVHALKIDRSFVNQPTNRREWGVERTIIELAKILNIDVIAEGIETREQFHRLRRAGCSQAQGYFFAGPVAPPQAELLIRDGYPLDLDVAAAG